MTRPGRRRIPFLLSLSLLLLAALSGPGSADDGFGYPKVKLEGLKRIGIQFSEYHVVFAKPGTEIALLGPGDRPLGVRLSMRDFCDAAMEGTVEVAGIRYTVSGKGGKSLATCAPPRYACARCVAYALGRNRFVKVKGGGALGDKSYGLVPYRTVAVRHGGLPLGTVLFIPAARGLRLPGGRVHDGYFFVGDIGAMRGTQLDLFVDRRHLAWSIIGSGTSASKTSRAYIVTDPAVVAPLEAAHLAAGKAATAE